MLVVTATFKTFLLPPLLLNIRELRRTRFSGNRSPLICAHSPIPVQRSLVVRIDCFSVGFVADDVILLNGIISGDGFGQREGGIIIKGKSNRARDKRTKGDSSSSGRSLFSLFFFFFFQIEKKDLERKRGKVVYLSIGIVEAIFSRRRFLSWISFPRYSHR